MDNYTPKYITLILEYEDFLHMKQLVEDDTKYMERYLERFRNISSRKDKLNPKLKIINPNPK